MTWGDLNGILASQMARVRLAKDGALVPPDRYYDERLRDGKGLNSAALAEELRQGATLIVDGIDDVHPPIRRLATELERESGESVLVNLYAGWGDSKGFDLHWDDHDVIVIQILGRKAWQVRGVSRRFPVQRDREANRQFSPPQPVLWEGHLEAGDFLYLPRGWWHAASAVAEPTLHLTISITKRNGLDFMKWLAESLIEEEAFREDIPDLVEPMKRREHFERLRTALVRHFDEERLEQFLQETRSAAPALSRFALPWQATAEVIPPGTALRIISLLPRSPRVATGKEPDTIEFSAVGHDFQFPTLVQPVLEKIFASHVIPFADLKAHLGADTPDENLRSLLIILARKRLIVVEPMP